MIALGYAPIPAEFKYMDVFLKSRPRHQTMDPFWFRHPSMDVAKRAKIFAPFDALRGFSAAIIAKDALYEAKRELSEEDKIVLNQKLSVLSELTRNSKAAGKNHVTVSVTYFVPCTDRNNESYRIRGRYETASDVCLRIDPIAKCLVLMNGQRICFEDISAISFDHEFEKHHEEWTEHRRCNMLR